MNSRDDSAIRHHQSLSEGWDARYRSGSFARRADFFRRKVLPALNTDGRWLDAGCGSGYFARMLAEQGAAVHGVDGAPGMITSARAAARDHVASDRISFEEISTVERLPFGDASFDGVLCLSVLEYVPDPKRALAEMTRVLPSGGQLVVSIPYTGSLIRAVASLRRRVRRRGGTGSAYLDSSHFTVSGSEVEPMLTAHGLVLDAVYPCDPSLGGFLAQISPNLFFIIARRT